MSKRGLCIPLPTKSTESPTLESSTPSTSLILEDLSSQDSRSPTTEPSITHSKPAATTYSGSSIHLLIQVDRKDVDVYFRLFVNHKSVGKLVMQTDEFDAFVSRISPVEIRNGAIDLKAQYYASIGGKVARRKLY